MIWTPMETSWYWMSWPKIGKSCHKDWVYTPWDSLAPLGACRLEMHSVRIVLTHSAQISSHDMSEWVQSRPVHAWSSLRVPRRGLGKGWKDPNSMPFFIGISTVKCCQPLVFALECVPCLTWCCMPMADWFFFRHDVLMASVRNEVESMGSRSSSGGAAGSNDQDADERSDLQKALDFVQKELGTLYSIYCWRKCQPMDRGFPILRPRWYASRMNVCLTWVWTNLDLIRA